MEYNKGQNHMNYRVILTNRYFLLTCLLLVTMLTWQFRFVRSSHQLIDDDACQKLSFWQGAPKNTSEISAGPEGLYLRKQVNGSWYSLSRNIDRMEGVRFLSLTMDAAWEQAEPDQKVLWSRPRLVVHGSDEKGQYCAPVDHGVINASGTRSWHVVSRVVDLPPQMKQVRLSIDAYGTQGVLRINHLRVEAVHQRPWFVTVTILLITAWIAMLTVFLLPLVIGRAATLRTVMLSAGMLLGAWQFVFPQGRTMFSPLATHFWMGSEIMLEKNPPPVVAPVATAPVVAAVPPVTPRQPRLRTIVPGNASTAAVPVAPTTMPVVVKEVPAVEIRERPQWTEKLRALDRRWSINQWNLTHFTAFLGVGLYVFLLAGNSRIWPLPMGIAVLGEIIPNALFDIWDRGDWFDVSANMLGILVAMIAVRFLRRKRRLPVDDLQGTVV